MSRITGTMAASALLLATVVLGAAMLAHAGTPSQPSTTERPIIGILTLPNHNKGHLGTLGTSYMAASYVKWVESGGARVVPLRYDDGPDALRQQAESLNGILFTGGGTAIQHENGTLSAVGEAGRALLGVVLDAHANGEHVPLWCASRARAPPARLCVRSATACCVQPRLRRARWNLTRTCSPRRHLPRL